MTNDEKVLAALPAPLAGRDQKRAMHITPLSKEIARETGIPDAEVVSILGRIFKVWPSAEEREEVGHFGKIAKRRYFWEAPAGWKPGDTVLPPRNVNVIADALARIEAKIDNLSVTNPAKVVTAEDECELDWWKAAANALQVERNTAWDRIAELDAEIARLKEGQ